MPDVRPKIHTPTATLSHKISTEIRIRSAFFLRRTQLKRKFPGLLERFSIERRKKFRVCFGFAFIILRSVIG